MVVHWHASPPPHCEKTRSSWSHRSLGQHRPAVRCNELLGLMRVNVTTAVEPLLPPGLNVAPAGLLLNNHMENRLMPMILALQQMDQMKEDKSLWRL